ncbi:nuclear cap-binding protein subunit 3 [Lampetra fluviatilis]
MAAVGTMAAVAGGGVVVDAVGVVDGVVVDVGGEEPMDVEEDHADETAAAAERDALVAVTVRRSIANLLTDTSRKYENKSGTFITGVDVTSKEAVQRKEQRAKRFHFRGDEEAPQSAVVLDKDALRKAVPEVRLDALFLAGVDDMSTEEIFALFRNYAPASIEWINDSSCNVVWLDEDSASRALLSLSQDTTTDTATTTTTDTTTASSLTTEPKAPEKPRVDDEYLSLMSDGDTEEEEEPGEWVAPSNSEQQQQQQRGGEDGERGEFAVLRNDLRLVTAAHARPCPLYMRFSTAGDRKELGAARRSRYYMKYGNPNYGGMKGIISSSWKRRYHSRRLQRDVFKKKSPTSGGGGGGGGGAAFSRSHGGELREVPEETILEEDEEEEEEDLPTLLIGVAKPPPPPRRFITTSTGGQTSRDLVSPTPTPPTPPMTTPTTTTWTTTSSCG